MLIIAERINSTRKSIAAAIESQDKAFIQQEALSQAQAGAHYIDVNAGAFIKDEIPKLKWLVRTVQEAVNLPLCIDSANVEAITEVLPLVKQRPMINSITLEPARLQGILPLALEHGAKLIALCQGESQIAETAENKIALAEKLVQKLQAENFPLDDLYIDPLVFPLSMDTNSAAATLSAIEQIKKRFAEAHVTCGLTNVSHGLPARKLINRTFLALAIGRGLDSAILDPTDRKLYSVLKAAWMVAGHDDYCRDFIQAFRKDLLE